MHDAPDIFSVPSPRPPGHGDAVELPTTREEMERLGWDACDVVLVTGDAFVDHPSFGTAVVGRVLQAKGFRVGVIPQPDWRGAEDFRVLGAPRLFFGVTAGNMDSMVNRYTSDRKVRNDDAYTPDGEAGRRPDRAVVVYAQRCREAFRGAPVVLGGIEASLRRVAHFDYWSEKVRRSVLLDAKAEMLLFGNAERAIVEVAVRLAAGEAIGALTEIRGTVFARPAGGEGRDGDAVRLPSFEEVSESAPEYARASRLLHRETNPGNARRLLQRHGDRDVVLNPPPLPLSTEELDRVFGLPYTRRPHSRHAGRSIPAYEMIKTSIQITRGCFGGCTFCSITEHEGRIIQSRSEESVLEEIAAVRERTPGFAGVISDLGGPTANMYRLGCREARIETACRRLSCLFPKLCPNLRTDHGPLIRLYRRAREAPGVKKVLVASGVRFDLAIRSPEYVRELATHHTGGYLKIAPEHTEPGPLAAMGKPGMVGYERFRELFDRYSREAGREQYLIPYFIAAHPGTTDEDMLRLALWLRRNGFRPDQVQTFLPSPMATATAMYRTGLDPRREVAPDAEPVAVPRGLRVRRLHKAFLRWHDPENWPLLREALVRMGRPELIGTGPQHLVPPAGTAPRKRRRR